MATPKHPTTPCRSVGDRESVSFESAFDSDLADEFGDLGPEAPRRPAAVVVPWPRPWWSRSPVTIGQTEGLATSSEDDAAIRISRLDGGLVAPIHAPVAICRDRGMDRGQQP